jgi:CheY-like chemotaxis protein
MAFGSINFNHVVMIVVAILLFVGVLIALNDQRKRNRPQQPLNRAPARINKRALKRRGKNKATKKHLVAKPFNNTIIYQILRENKLAINNVLFNLNYLLDEIAGIIASDNNANKNELLFDIEKNVPVNLIGDPMRITQVLVNLLDNAIKSSHDSIVILKISVKNKNKNLCNLHFEIIDNSSKMSQEQIQELFSEPSGDILDDRKMAFFISDRLTTLMGGKISVSNLLENNNLVQLDLEFSVPKKYQAYKYQIPSAGFEKEKVAIIERFSQTAKILKKQLNYFSPHIETIAYDALLSNPSQLEDYDMIVIDENIYDRAIENTIEKIKEIKTIKVVLTENILTQHQKDNKTVDAVDSYLAKPFTLERVIELLIGFYGEGSIPVNEGDEAESETHRQTNKSTKANDTFKSNEEIPAQANITKDDFKTFIGSKVLITEDNMINQKVIMGLLGSSGINLKLAEDGQEALDILEEDAPFDLILMDINMPVMDGYEATRRIRENRHYDSMPIVAFTGLNLKDEIEKMREVGMNAHMAKPLNIGRIYSVFERYLPKKNLSA